MRQTMVIIGDSNTNVVDDEKNCKTILAEPYTSLAVYTLHT